jgi:hypothetical protein
MYKIELLNAKSSEESQIVVIALFMPFPNLFAACSHSVERRSSSQKGLPRPDTLVKLMDDVISLWDRVTSRYAHSEQRISLLQEHIS